MPNLPSDDQLAELALAGLDHLFVKHVEWDGFDEVLRKGLIVMKAKGSGDDDAPQGQNPPPPTALDVLEKRRFNDFVATLYSARIDQLEIRIIAATHLQRELQYLWGLAVPPVTQRPPGADNSEDSLQTQVAMIAANVRMMGLFPSPFGLGASMQGGRVTVGLRVPAGDWAKPMSPESAFDVLAPIAADFYRMLPKQYSASVTFTFRVGGMSRDITRQP